MDQLAQFFDAVTAFIDSLAGMVTDSPVTYLLILLMAAVDVLFPILPAEAVVTAAAVLAGQGSLDIAWVMLAAGIGAFIGDNIAYAIGRAAGRPLVQRLLRGDTHQLDAVRGEFDRHGGTFVIIGRFVPGGRTVVAVGAGVLHFPWLRFVAYDALAAAIWAFQASLPGYIGGSLIQDQPWLAMVFGFILSGLLAAGIALFQRWRSRSRPTGLPLRPAVIGAGGGDPGPLFEADEVAMHAPEPDPDADATASDADIAGAPDEPLKPPEPQQP
jgi:membrane-associated protein